MLTLTFAIKISSVFLSPFFKEYIFVSTRLQIIFSVYFTKEIYNIRHWTKNNRAPLSSFRGCLILLFYGISTFVGYLMPKTYF